jgi:hypothetical protein
VAKVTGIVQARATINIEPSWLHSIRSGEQIDAHPCPFMHGRAGKVSLAVAISLYVSSQTSKSIISRGWTGSITHLWGLSLIHRTLGLCSQRKDSWLGQTRSDHFGAGHNSPTVEHRSHTQMNGQYASSMCTESPVLNDEPVVISASPHRRIARCLSPQRSQP